MKISVLLSVYNKEKPEYLDKALESITKQTLMPNEIVIIKDGIISEELEQVIEKYYNKYSKIIRVFGIEQHNGLGLALRFGVEKCKYEYIARMDSDDYYTENRLEEQCKYLKRNMDIDVLGAYVDEYDENLKIKLSTKTVPLDDRKIKKAIKVFNPINHGTTIIRKSKLLESGNYRNILIEDYDLWIRMILKNCKFANIPIVVSKNRTGIRMYKKRSGKEYIKAIMQIENILLKYRIINKLEYYINVITRKLLAKTPISMKYKIYPKIRKIKIFQEKNKND